MMLLLHHASTRACVERSLQDGISANLYDLCGNGVRKMGRTIHVLMAYACPSIEMINVAMS